MTKSKSTESSDRTHPLLFPHHLIVSIQLSNYPAIQHHFTLWGGSVSLEFFIVVSLHFLHALTPLLYSSRCCAFSLHHCHSPSPSHQQDSRDGGEGSILADIFVEYISLLLLWTFISPSLITLNTFLNQVTFSYPNHHQTQTASSSTTLNFYTKDVTRENRPYRV